MGIFSRFEDRMEDTVEGAASRVSKAPISPVQIAKKAEKQMRRETMVGAGKQYAPTLYTVLVNADDDKRLFGYYPTLAGETETYLSAKATQEGLVMDGSPLVRFIVDEGLHHGKFEVIAEVVAAPIVAELRDEEMERYGLAPRSKRGTGYAQPAPQPAYRQEEAYGSGDQQAYQSSGAHQPQEAFGYAQMMPQQPRQEVPRKKPPLPYVPEEEIDRSIDYGEYTFNSEDFENYRDTTGDSDAPVAYNDAFAQRIPAVTDSMVDADGSAGVAAVDVPDPFDDGRPQSQMANTVAFAAGGGSTAQQVTPNHRAVLARLVDLTYQRPYDLAGTRFTLGRETGNDIKVQDINASRRHAELTLSAQGLWVITDLRSMNGTLVNGVSVASQPLYPGDIITIGKSEFEFTLA